MEIFEISCKELLTLTKKFNILFIENICINIGIAVHHSGKELMQTFSINVNYRESRYAI